MVLNSSGIIGLFSWSSKHPKSAPLPGPHGCIDQEHVAFQKQGKTPSDNNVLLGWLNNLLQVQIRYTHMGMCTFPCERPSHPNHLLLPSFAEVWGALMLHKRQIMMRSDLGGGPKMDKRRLGLDASGWKETVMFLSSGSELWKITKDFRSVFWVARS